MKTSEYIYNLKAKKYKKKYLDLKSQIAGYKEASLVYNTEPQPKNTEHYRTKFIKGHGHLTGEQYILPIGVNVITLTENNVNMDGSLDYDSVIHNHLKTHKILFKDNDNSTILTDEGRKLQDTLNKMKDDNISQLLNKYQIIIDAPDILLSPSTLEMKKSIIKNLDILKNLNFKIRNHIGTNLLPINDMIIDFSPQNIEGVPKELDPCIKYTCSINVYNPTNNIFVRPHNIEKIDLKWYKTSKNTDDTKTTKTVLNTPFFLSDLIEKEGPGVYIVSACREIHHKPTISQTDYEEKTKLVRQTSNQADIIAGDETFKVDIKKAESTKILGLQLTPGPFKLKPGHFGINLGNVDTKP